MQIYIFYLKQGKIIGFFTNFAPQYDKNKQNEVEKNAFGFPPLPPVGNIMEPDTQIRGACRMAYHHQKP
jgi:hypothetical protein